MAGGDITVPGVTRLGYNGQHRGDLMLSRYWVPSSLHTNTNIIKCMFSNLAAVYKNHIQLRISAF